ncbi:hypothetical protein, partial [Vibrio cholerae]|uniref:hypothetical protein n=1 Tax=Vibrio cholerae TaxID=666 RepID=UPI000E0B8986
VNPQVAGSSPAGGATFRNPVYDWVLFYLSKVLSIENSPTLIALLTAKERQTVKFALEKLSA